MDLIKALNEKQLQNDVPQVEVGDTVRVHVKVKEGARERVQVFEGTVIAKKHGGIEETFTVRRISYGVGVEKVFPVHSPSIVKVETVRHGYVRRAKLYYLRDRSGKAARIKEQETHLRVRLFFMQLRFCADTLLCRHIFMQLRIYTAYAATLLCSPFMRSCFSMRTKPLHSHAFTQLNPLRRHILRS